MATNRDLQPVSSLSFGLLDVYRDVLVSRLREMLHDYSDLFYPASFRVIDTGSLLRIGLEWREPKATITVAEDIHQAKSPEDFADLFLSILRVKLDKICPRKPLAKCPDIGMPEEIPEDVKYQPKHCPICGGDNGCMHQRR
jgi:hypothetical protein